MYGLSINEDMPTIRNMMAVCPQFDILWDNLTGEKSETGLMVSEGAFIYSRPPSECTQEGNR